MMEASYAGLDVSDRVTHVCVLDEAGRVVWRGGVASDPEALATSLTRHASGLVRAVVETGPLSSWLVAGLRAAGVPAVCICARQAKAALSARGHKSDARDAAGLAQLARTGWYREVHVKGPRAQADRALLGVRERLVRVRRDLLNQLRGMLRGFGVRLGQLTTDRRLEAGLASLGKERPELVALVRPLLAIRVAAGHELAALDERVAEAAAADPACRRLLTVPGVGALTALAFAATIEDPARFARPAQVAAYVGLVPRQHQSGEMDLRGAILKHGDTLLRHLLYEAANSLLGRVKRSCALRDWGLALQARLGPKRARVAVARKLAVLLRRLWLSGESFRWQPA
jgi:transposase